MDNNQLTTGNRQRAEKACSLSIAYGLLLIVFYLLSTTCSGQVFPISNYNTSHGLINNRTGTAAQDSAGYMWFGTDNGICNYDGRSFHFFPGSKYQYYFAHSYLNAYGDSVVFSTARQGIAICYKNNVEFKTFPGSEQLSINSVLPIGKDSFLLACIDKGIKFLFGKNLQPLPLADSLRLQLAGAFMLYRDRHRNIWVGNEKGLLVFPRGDFSKPVYLTTLRGRWINAIEEDREGNIYVVCNTAIYKFESATLNDIVNAKPVLFYQDENDGLSTISFDQAGNIYIASQQYKGVIVLNKQRQPIAAMQPENGLAAAIVWDVFVDRENNGWICTENGVSKFNQTFFRNYPSLKNDYPNFKAGVLLNDSSILVNNGNNFSLITDNKRTAVSLTGIYEIYVGYLEERFFKTSDGKLWMNAYDNAQMTAEHTYEIQLSRDKIRVGQPVDAWVKGFSTIDGEKTCHDRSGRDFFIDAKKKPWVYEHSKFYPCYPGRGFPAVTDLYGITCDQEGNLWLFSFEYGLIQTHLRKEEHGYAMDTMATFPVATAKKDNSVKLHVDHKNRIWLASAPHTGIRCYEKTNQSRYTLAESLVPGTFDNSFIREIVTDDAGYLYVGTNFGVYRVDARGQRTGAVDRDMFAQYLTGKYIYFLQYRNSKLYIGTTGSVAVVSLGNIYDSKVSPLVFITGMSVNNKPADSLLQNSELRLSPGDNTLSFTFTSPSYINENKIAYKYYLEGADHDWSAVNAGYIANYIDLKPGRYTLKVLAQNANGVWSTVPAEFSFIIRTPFYKQWWFIAICIVVLAAIMYALYRFRLSKMLAVERTRQKISKDLHDDVGSALSSITLMNAVLKKKITTNPGDAVDLAEKVEETSREMIQNMSDIVWSINPGNDGLEKLQSRLQQFAGAIFEPRNIQYKLIFPKEMTDRSLSMELRRDIYLICKEIMNNAAKYSEANHFTLRFTQQRNKLEILAEDDGKGFDVMHIKKGNGLTNIEQRVKNYQGSWDLKSDSKGTRWYVTISTRSEG